MDHSEVVRLQAVEKYVLGELPAELRDEFEEHYFDCGECAEDVKQLTMFVTASGIVLEEKPRAMETDRAKPAGKAGWFAWLRPMIAIPAMAALAAIVIFQNVVTIPSLRHGATTDGAVEVFSSSYRLQGVTRGEGSSPIMVSPAETFAVAYPSYTGKLVDSNGKMIVSFAVGGEMANKEMHLVVPTGKARPGDYALVIAGAGEGAKEVQRIPFAVAYRP